jgi:hypothetical protein
MQHFKVLTIGSGQVKVWPRSNGEANSYVMVRTSPWSFTAHPCLPGYPAFAIRYVRPDYDEVFAANLSGSRFFETPSGLCESSSGQPLPDDDYDVIPILPANFPMEPEIVPDDTVPDIAIPDDTMTASSMSPATRAASRLRLWTTTRLRIFNGGLIAPTMSPTARPRLVQDRDLDADELED